MMTDDVLVFDDTAPQAYARFINWISQSVQAQSRSVSTRGETRVSLAKCDADLLADRQIAPALTSHDDRFAVFIARCAERSAPYIVKYERHLNRIETADPALAQMFQTRNYALVMAVPAKNSYFEMSDSQSGAQPVSSADLIGQPACPHCQARFGMAVCA